MKLKYSVDEISGVFRLGEIEIHPGMSISQFRSSVRYGEHDEHRYMHTLWLEEKLHFEYVNYRVCAYFEYDALKSISICDELNEAGRLPIKNRKEQRSTFERMAKELMGSYCELFPWGKIRVKPVGEDHLILEIKYGKSSHE